MSELVAADCTLIGAALHAPLMAIRRRWPDTTHAIDMESVVDGWDRGTFESVCGLSGLRLVGWDGLPLGWPPRVQDSPFVRCRECWVATGKRRPRTTYTPKGDS